MRVNAVERAHREFGGITASMAPTIAGVGFESAFTLYHRMIGELPPVEETWEMWLGRQMEPVIIKAFSHETKLKVFRPRRVFDPSFFYTTDEYGFPMGALLDGYTIEDGDNVGIEAKHPSVFSSDWHDEPPFPYYLQVQHQMACTGWARFYAIALVGKKLVVHCVLRDEGVIAMLTDRERDFWTCLQRRVPPMIDGSEATTAYLRERFPKSDPDLSMWLEDPEIDRMCQSHLAYTEAIKKMEGEKQELANRLLGILETSESAITPHHKITAKTRTTSRVDTKRLRAEWPAAADACTTESTSRPVLVSELKGDS